MSDVCLHTHNIFFPFQYLLTSLGCLISFSDAADVDNVVVVDYNISTSRDVHY